MYRILDEQNIFHYGKLDLVDDAILNTYSDALVILQSNTERKHEQIRILPFNAANTDKESLPFVEKRNFFNRVTFGKGDTKEITPENFTVLATHVTDFFTPRNGLADEIADFNDGFNNGMVTGFENNYVGFFSSHFVDLDKATLSDLRTGLGIS